MKQIKELFEDMTPIEVVSEVAGWAGMFIILFMLSVIL